MALRMKSNPFRDFGVDRRVRRAQPYWASGSGAFVLGMAADLTRLVAQPDAMRLTEQQRSLALGALSSLVTETATLLLANVRHDAVIDPATQPVPVDPIIVQRTWQLLASSGLKAADHIAWPLLLRVLEHSWLTQRRSDPADAGTPVADTEPAPEWAQDGSAVDMALLNLRLWERDRVDAFGLPLLRLGSLHPYTQAQIIADTAAALIRLNAATSEELAAAADDASVVLAAEAEMATPGRIYAESVATSGHSHDVLRMALEAHDWTAAFALLAITGSDFDRDSVVADVVCERIGAVETRLAALGFDGHERGQALALLFPDYLDVDPDIAGTARVRPSLAYRFLSPDALQDRAIRLDYPDEAADGTRP